MSGIYDDMQSALAYQVETFASQGVIVYNAPGTEGDPFNPPTAGVDYPISGWNITGSKRNKYIEGGYIVSSDVLISVVPFSVAPVMSGKITINGNAFQIIMIDPATLDPDNPVVWRIGCRK